MTQRFVLHHVEPRSLREARVPRTLTEAFGPYARLDTASRRPDRGLYVAAVILAASVAALLLAGLTR